MLFVRPVASGDADPLLEILGDPNVAGWLRPPGREGPFTRAESEAIIVQKVAHWTAHGFGMSLAFLDGRCVGRSIVQHNNVAGRSEVEIGWAVAEPMWGRGIATELGAHALRTATGAGFERVVAFTRTDNTASRRVMESSACATSGTSTTSGCRTCSTQPPTVAPPRTKVGPASHGASPFAGRG